MRRIYAVLLAAALCCGLLAEATGAEELFHSVGPGQGILIDRGSRDLPCGFGNLTINSDELYDNGYAWSYCANQSPDWGAFAECYYAAPQIEICALVFDLTRNNWQGGMHQYLMDAYVWDEMQAPEEPGNVIAMHAGFDPYPVDQYPHFTRFAVPLVVPVDGPFWIGEWGNWDNTPLYQWYVAADTEGPGQGCPKTKIHPCTGYPSGWQDVSIVWGETHALGIGYYSHVLSTSGTPVTERGELTSWGRVKSIYR